MNKAFIAFRAKKFGEIHPKPVRVIGTVMVRGIDFFFHRRKNRTIVTHRHTGRMLTALDTTNMNEIEKEITYMLGIGSIYNKIISCQQKEPSINP